MAEDAEWKLVRFELVGCRECPHFELPHWHARFEPDGKCEHGAETGCVIRKPFDYCSRHAPIESLPGPARAHARACARVVADKFGALDETRAAFEAMRASGEKGLPHAVYKLLNGG